jgi:hypothetical protein
MRRHTKVPTRHTADLHRLEAEGEWGEESDQSVAHQPVPAFAVHSDWFEHQRYAR